MRRFHVGFDEAQPLAAVGFQVRHGDRDRAIHESGLLARHEMKAQLFHLRFESEVHRRGVDAAAHERCQAFLGAAQLQERNVFRRVEAGVFEHDAQDQRRLAANPVNANFLAAQLRQVVDFVFGHDRVGNQIVPAAEGSHGYALQVGLDEPRRRARGGIDIAGDQRLISRRFAVDADDLGLQTIFLEEALFLGDEHRIGHRREQRHADTHAILRRCVGRRAG